MLRCALAIPFIASLSQAAFVYECGNFYDCVTPFQGRVRTPLPPARSIPYPEGVDPRYFETPMMPRVSNALGHVAGSVGFTASLPLPYFFDGVRSIAANRDIGLVARDISDTDLIVFNLDGGGGVYIYQATAPIPPGLTEVGAQALGDYWFGPYGRYLFTSSLAISADGRQILLRGNKYINNLNNPTIEWDLELLYSMTPLDPIPEPPAGSLTFAGIVVLVCWRMNRKLGAAKKAGIPFGDARRPADGNRWLP